jgi:hypothetical protein
LVLIGVLSITFIVGLFVFPVVALFLQGRDGLPRGPSVLPRVLSTPLNAVLIVIIVFMLWLFASALWIGLQRALA